MMHVKQFLDYAASQEEAIITFNASNMILNIRSDASYLSENNARSQAGGHHFLSDATDHAPHNCTVLNISSIIKNVMSSAAEDQLGAYFSMPKQPSPRGRHWRN